MSECEILAELLLNKEHSSSLKGARQRTGNVDNERPSENCGLALNLLSRGFNLYRASVSKLWCRNKLKSKWLPTCYNKEKSEKSKIATLVSNISDNTTVPKRKTNTKKDGADDGRDLKKALKRKYEEIKPLSILGTEDGFPSRN